MEVKLIGNSKMNLIELNKKHCVADVVPLSAPGHLNVTYCKND